MTTVAEFAAAYPHAFARWASQTKLADIAVETYVPDWDNIDECFQFVTVDQDGAVWAYTDRPRISDEDYNWEWVYTHPHSRVTCVECIDPDLCSGDKWRTMIYQRPKFAPDWDTLPAWVQFVAVDLYGRVYCYEERPHFSRGGPFWMAQGNREFVAELPGAPFDKWREMIYERPNGSHS